MTRSLVEKYQMGMITDDHLVVESLHMIDPDNPGLVLSALPDKILPRVLRFVKDYLDGRMVTNFGVMPAQDQALAARAWVETALQHMASKPA
jgi:hypothetical protein